MSLKARWTDLLDLFSAGRGDGEDPEAAQRIVTAAMAQDDLLTGLMVALADRLDELCVAAGDAGAARYAIEHDGQAAELAASIVHRLNEAAKPPHLRATAGVAR